MNVPAIGRVRGIFGIFVPGLFLLVNFSVCVYSAVDRTGDTGQFLRHCATEPTMGLVMAIGLGYLMGVILRLLQTDVADRCSAWWLRRFSLHVRQEELPPADPAEKGINRAGQRVCRMVRVACRRLRRPRGAPLLYATENFPYISWLGYVCKRDLPDEARAFYQDVWLPRAQLHRSNREFFNFCKTILSSLDERASFEVFAAEDMSRYVAGMFYALIAATLSMLGAFVVMCLRGEFMGVFLVVAGIYLFAVWRILNRFRILRIKETQTLFAAMFRHSDKFRPWTFTTHP
ncbi:MAG: hypothetical protein JXL80_11105 [Planctomycetes bacterium]|nr:hypothetical protein [Planctomycetota bacterium]